MAAAPGRPRAGRSAAPTTSARRGLPARILAVGGALALAAGLGAGALVSEVRSPAGGADDRIRAVSDDAALVGDAVLADDAALAADAVGPLREGHPSRGGELEPPPADPDWLGTEIVEETALTIADPYEVDASGLSPADRAVGLTGTDASPASGTLAVVPGNAAAPRDADRVLAVRVEVEEGLPVDPAVFAATVMEILNDPRGWGADGSVAFARTDGHPDLRVVLASPDKVDEMCAPLRTVGEYSCGRYGHAALNFTRWAEGTAETPTGADLATYREYLVSHEVGHLLGHQHVTCPGEGEVAPVMQQQSVRAAPCVLNGWPFPGVDR